MKKKTGKAIVLLCVLALGIFIGRIDFSKFKEEAIQNKKALAVYIEGDDGEYTLSSSNKFPTDGYVLNTERSACTNGGTLSQNAETKAISMSTSNKSECNLYFNIFKEDKAKDTLDVLNVSSRGSFNEFTFTAPEQVYAVPDINSLSESSYSMSSTKYMTYSSSYTFDSRTGLYTLENPKTCKYTSCYSTLKGEYIVNMAGSTSSTAEKSYDLATIFYVTNNANSSSLKYKTLKPTITSYDSSNDGVYSMEDDYGTSYYYRGAVENNYVKFAGFYWRIVRINGNGSLRIIYDGTSAYANGVDNSSRFAILDQGYRDGRLSRDLKYFGWMYGPADGSTATVSLSKEQAQSNEVSLEIKNAVDDWYKTNIEDKGYGQYVSDTLFCNDRSIPGKAVTKLANDTGLGYGTGSNVENMTGYGGYVRINTNITTPAPSFKCAQKNDAFTVSDTSKGNGALKYPVGLITADEVMAAGSGMLGKNNTKYYLYKGSYVMSTMTPSYGGVANGATVGLLLYMISTFGGLMQSDGGASEEIAPVINLTPEFVQTMIGTGTRTDPYRAP